MKPDKTKQKGPTLPTQQKGGDGKPVWHRVFLAALKNTCNVRLSATSAGIDRTTAYEHRKKDKVFEAQWDEAVQDACDALEASIWNRAVNGVDEPIYMKNEKGEIVKVADVKKYSDVLAMFILKKHRPEYCERYRNEHSAPGGGPIQLEHSTKAKPLSPDECRLMLERTGGDPLDRFANGNGNKTDRTKPV